MNIESHRAAIKESIEVIRESLEKGSSTRQRNIGFNCSSAATNIIELYLHTLNIIKPSANIKYDWFASLKKAERKIPFDFPEKNKIFRLAVEIENKRMLLCYGKPMPAEAIEDAIFLFNKLKSELEKLGVRYE